MRGGDFNWIAFFIRFYFLLWCCCYCFYWGLRLAHQIWKLALRAQTHTSPNSKTVALFTQRRDTIKDHFWFGVCVCLVVSAVVQPHLVRSLTLIITMKTNERITADTIYSFCRTSVCIVECIPAWVCVQISLFFLLFLIISSIYCIWCSYLAILSQKKTKKKECSLVGWRWCKPALVHTREPVCSQ